MQVMILIEPKNGGEFRATTGEPFRLSAEGSSEEAATCHLETMLHARLKGVRVAFLEVKNGSPQGAKGPLCFDPVVGEDEFFQDFRNGIEENRQRENEAQG
jgi:hypothetical protein